MLPEPPRAAPLRLVDIASTEGDWWPPERRGAFLESMSPLQRERIDVWRVDTRVRCLGAYRRTRNGRAVWEVRSDEIAGALRTTGGGSSRQALVRVGRGCFDVRWMDVDEYARLQGAENLRYGAVSERQAMFALGDAVCVPVIEWLGENWLTRFGGLSSGSPPDVDALYMGVTRLFDLADTLGRKAGDCTRGVYLFIDYDGKPIYVGQTTEKLRTRIRRHLTNQRTDAVAMRVLDPFEVAEVEMWPFWDLEGRDSGDTLDRAEFTVYQKALTELTFSAVLNEGEIVKTEMIELPQSVRGTILPEGCSPEPRAS